MGFLRALRASLVLSLVVTGLAGAQLDPLAEGRLHIRGNRLTIYADELTTDADQTVNVGERARIRTCFGGPTVPCGSLAAGDPRVAGLLVRGELRGPELPQAVTVETVPGGSFVLPSFQQEGDYRLENLRLVEASSGRILGAAEPSLAFVRVREILLASATVRALSLEELRARGIAVSAENFQAFDFAVGFAIEGEIVEIEFPVLFEGPGGIGELARRADVQLDGLPEHVVQTVSRWQPPRIVPFRLDPARPEARDQLEVNVEPTEILDFPLLGAIVIPGNVTYLNQFFEAQLVVTNGAGAGSSVELDRLYGALRLPTSRALRLGDTDPPVAAGQPVPVVRADGGRRLAAGAQGTAAWTVEGLIAGTHTLDIEVSGEVVRPGRDPLPILSRVQAAVEVVDARFNLAFSHPDVVREGEAYSLFVTVSNLSRVTQNLITVELRSEHLSGAHAADSGDDLRRTIETLPPGQAQTLEFPLVSELTGKVVATTFQSSSAAGQGTIRLRAGVGELGIPLSPATLIMPRFTERLQPPHADGMELVRANVRLLGLAHSLAVAPAAMVPPGLPRVIARDVERRAIDLAEAGQRLFLGEGMLESLSALTLDQLGNREPLAELDELRRSTVKGLRAGEAMAALLRAEQQSRDLDAVELLDRFAETVSYAPPWMAALVVPEGTEPAPVLELQGAAEGTVGRLAHPADDEAQAVRTLPFGEIFALAARPGSEALAPFLVVGHLAPQQVFELRLSAGAEPAAGRLVLIVPDGDSGDYRRLDFGEIYLPPGTVARVAVGAGVDDPSSGGFVLHDASSGAVMAEATRDTVPLPPFRLIGAVQDVHLAESGPDAFGNMTRPNRYGNGISYLFNRPPEKAAAEDPAAWRIESSFAGLDTQGEPVSGTVELVAEASWVQDSERVVNVRYTRPLSALLDLDGSPLLDHRHRLDTVALVDRRGESLSADVPKPRIDEIEEHPGGLLRGRVLRGTGDPVPGADVVLYRLRKKLTKTGYMLLRDRVAAAVTDADGGFFFASVETPLWDPVVLEPYYLRVTVPAGDDPLLEPASVEEVSSRIRLLNRVATINVALLGRGNLIGRLVYLDDQTPIAGAEVVATSSLFDEQKRVETDAEGRFAVPWMPVGPITLAGYDEDGGRVYATVGIQAPGQTVDVLLEMPRGQGDPGSGTVGGRVVQRDGASGDWLPVTGAQVRVYSAGAAFQSMTTDLDGRFLFRGVPAGQVSLQAAAWEASRTSVVADLQLADGAAVDVELRLPAGGGRTVAGRVLLHDLATGETTPLAGAVAFIPGPGSYAYTDAAGRYAIEGVPIQGVGEGPYRVTVIDYARAISGEVAVEPVLESSPDPIPVVDLVLEVGSLPGSRVDGVVLDPLGRPLPGAEVVLVPWAETVSGADGGFSFLDVPLGQHRIAAHVGDGLASGAVGWIGETAVHVASPGHRPFVEVRLLGSGTVTVKTRTGSATGVLSPIYYRPTYFSDGELRVRIRGSYLETTTDPNGDLQLELPVGPYEIVAYNPFHGTRTIAGEVPFAGAVVHHDIVFQDTGAVGGQVLDIDGVTPVPGAMVTLATASLLPQTQLADAQGRFRFELVPKGNVSVTAAARVGSVDRVGRTDGLITGPGQELEVELAMKEQGTVRGRVVELWNGEERPLAFAQVAVYERSYPFRRFPESGWLRADAAGRYEVSQVYAGRVTVIGRDPLQPSRSGSVWTDIDADFQIRELADIVLSTSIGSLAITVRDGASGATIPDAVVRVGADADVTGPEGRVLFDTLTLGHYTVYAFNAPTGQAGHVTGVHLASPGEHREVTLYLDQRGEIRGTLYDDPARTSPRPGGTVGLRLRGFGFDFWALATTQGSAGNEGRFVFSGIPEGSFTLEARVPDSARRASASGQLTATSPIVDVGMVLDQLADVWVRLEEALAAGTVPVDLEAGVFSIRALQSGTYDVTRIDPEPGTNLFRFRDMYAARGATFIGQELSGEQRSRWQGISEPLSERLEPGSGTAEDPFRLVLHPRSVVRVQVVGELGQPIPGAAIRLGDRSGQGQRHATADAEGQASFYNVVGTVGGGWIQAWATSPASGLGGHAAGTLYYDDQILDLTVTLAAAVSAHGRLYEPLPADRYFGDPSALVPKVGAIVELVDAKGRRFSTVTGDDGIYRFDGLATGGYSLGARSADGAELARQSGILAGPDGTDNPLPSLILDASPPRIVSLAPSPGARDVALDATVEVVFSEPLGPQIAPNGVSTSSYFRLDAPDGTRVPGRWTSVLESSGRHVVRFTPTASYANLTIYSLTIKGGAAGVRDRLDRPLSESGDVGSSFTSADAIGPVVTGTEPGLELPVDPAVPIRVDFDERVMASGEALDGDGVDDAVELAVLRDDGAWVPLPVSLVLTRDDFSLLVDPIAGIAISGDTGRRRLSVDRLRDVAGNPMTPFMAEFQLRDERPPLLVDVPLPPGATDGALIHGLDYLLLPVVEGLDGIDGENPDGDLARVEYFFADPDEPLSAPAYVAAAAPWGFAIVAAYAGDGSTPMPFPLWVRAADASENLSNVFFLDLRILPNGAPSIGAVTVGATAPVAGVAYAGSTLAAEVAGLVDPDSAQVSLAAELWRDGGAQPVSAVPARTVVRPAAGWAALAPEVFAFTLPTTAAEGSRFFVRARAVDSQGGDDVVDSATFAVADDTIPPAVTAIAARRASDDAVATHFILGQELYLEVIANDGETRVSGVAVAFDRSDVFPSPLVASAVAGQPGLYRTAPVRVPAGVFSGELAIVVTATASDAGGNDGSGEATLTVETSDDPLPPVATWRTPWDGGEWPADYSSTLGAAGVPFLLRAEIADADLDAAGGEVAGELVEVVFRGPVAAAGGGVEPAAEWIPARRLAGSEGADGGGLYEAAWRVPNALPAGTPLDFEVRATDTGGNVTVAVARLEAVPARRVYEAVETAVGPEDAMQLAGSAAGDPVFVLDGAVLSLFPSAGGDARSLDRIYLYSGASDAGDSVEVRGSVLTVPQILSFDSVVSHYPLDIEVAQLLAIGAGSAIDVTARGLHPTSVDWPNGWDGAAPAEPNGVGSHAGLGTLNSNYDGFDGLDPGGVYGQVRRPQSPGGSGYSASINNRGRSHGGGVVHLTAPAASVRLEGEIRADGGSNGSYPAGAGGSVWLEVGHLAGAGAISASGGDSHHGGGGGGRIALHYHQLGDGFDAAAQLAARGGVSPGGWGCWIGDRGGAGTQFLQPLDAAGLELGAGTLVVDNPVSECSSSVMGTRLPALGEATLLAVDPLRGELVVDAPAAVGSIVGEEVVVSRADGGLVVVKKVLGARRAADGTIVLAVDPEGLATVADEQVTGSLAVRGRSRYDRVTIRGQARAQFGDEVVAGAIEVLDRARLALAGEETVVEFSEVSPPAGEVPLGSRLTARFRILNPLGVKERRFAYRVGDDTSPGHELHSSSQPTILDDVARQDFAIGLDATPGRRSFLVWAGDAALRRTLHRLEWEVLPNAPPAVEATVSGGGLAVQAGHPLSLVVVADDREALASLTVTASGPVGAASASQSFTLGGRSQTVPVTVATLAEADGSEPIVVTATVTDHHGLTASTTLTVTVVGNLPPVVELALAEGAVAAVKPGQSTVFRVAADDPDGVASLALRGSVALVEPEQVVTVSGDHAEHLFAVALRADAEPGPLSMIAVATDVFGESAESAPFVLTVLDDVPPAVLASLAAGTPTSVLPGQTVAVRVQASDEEGIDRLVLRAEGPVVASEVYREVGGATTADEVLLVELSKTATAGATVTLVAEVVDTVGQGVAAAPLHVAVLADTTPPTVEVSGVAASYWAGQELAATIASADDVGVAKLEIVLDGVTVTRDLPLPVEVHRRTIARDLAAPRTVSFTVVAEDLHGNRGSSEPIAVLLSPDPPPLVELELLSSPVLPPGGAIEAVAHLRDNLDLDTVTFTLGGPLGVTLERAVRGPAVVEPLRWTLPGDLLGGETVPLEVSVTDRFGHTATDQVTVTVTADGVAPEVTILEIPASRGATVASGAALQWAAVAGDAAGTTGVELTIDGASYQGDSPLLVAWTAPVVAVPTEVAIAARAWDAGGNVGTASRRITVLPPSGGLPTVEFTCPTSGALLPAEHAVELRLAATDDVGVVAVDVYRDAATAPFVTVVPEGPPEGGSLAEVAVVASDALPAVAGETTVTYRAVARDGEGQASAEATIVVHVVPTVDLLADGAGVNDWSALESQVAVLRAGTLTLTTPRTLGGLILLPGATLTHALASPGAETAVELTVSGRAYVACGAAVDATGRGYGSRTSYPGVAGSRAGGSHLGIGGAWQPSYEGGAFGSLTQPREPGGGADGARGGGVVHLAAAELVVDGAIRADGQVEPGDNAHPFHGGAGGSLWIEVSGSITGAGTLSAAGAVADRGSSQRSGGGGGAIALSYGALDPSLAERIDARGGSGGDLGIAGGPGAIVRRGPGSRFGELAVDNRLDPVYKRLELPSLGSGIAGSGSGNALLATGRASIPAFFVGHWVEILSGADGVSRGYGRVAAIAGGDLTLEPEEGSLTVAPGDRWQGVYRFDRMTTRGEVPVVSADPIRLDGELDVGPGRTFLPGVRATAARVRQGALLGHRLSNAAAPERLELVLAGDLVIEPDAAIDVSRLGYRSRTTYPGATLPGGWNGTSGGSHIGRGGNVPGSTYGSLTRPLESGGGSYYYAGGGVVRVEARDIVLLDETSRIAADGEGLQQGLGGARGGGGGSVWITARQIQGRGRISADGGDESRSGDGAGGGGAIALELDRLPPGFLSQISASGGTSDYGNSAYDELYAAGGGSIVVRGPLSTHGDLWIDNGRSTHRSETLLPALGAGTAQAGSAGATLVTAQPTIPPYFVGHWVEIHDGEGVYEGAWRIATIDGGRLVLEATAGVAAAVDPGDRWQGIYRFENVRARGPVVLTSADPIRVGEWFEIADSVSARQVDTTRLVLRAGASLTHPPTVDPAQPESLTIRAREVVIEPGAAIDVSGRGYGPGRTHPGETVAGGRRGGCHLGRGGEWQANTCTTFGSVTRPQENGGGGEAPGGGTVRILSDRLELQGTTSAIRANGTSWNALSRASGAGGSIWITAAEVAGDGTIEAGGEPVRRNSGWGGGGGGAIAVEYETTSGSVLGRLHAWPGPAVALHSGAAGTIYLRDGESRYGRLQVDDAGLGAQATVLPALGGGIAQAGSAVGHVATARAQPIPSYFVGHWVEIRDGASGELEGAWRVAAVSGTAFELELTEPRPRVEPGDRWQGVYRFDEVTYRGLLQVLSDDPIQVMGSTTVDGRLEIAGVSTGDLEVTSRGWLRALPPENKVPRPLHVVATGQVAVAPGGRIDATGRGYPGATTYPGETIGGHGEGASHLGQGRHTTIATQASTYGSVTRPREAGASTASAGSQPGGGVVDIAAASLHLAAGAGIHADGGPELAGGWPSAGGSVWIRTLGAVTGGGAITARGATSAFTGGSAGGGAIAIEHGGLAAEILAGLDASGDTTPVAAGAGTVYLRGPESTHGDLHVLNAGVPGHGTRLPALGSGSAQPGSGGRVLVTDRGEFQPYFLGHLVEVRDGASDLLEGTFRVAEIAGGVLTLEGEDPPRVDPGDRWQGVYVFDRLVHGEGSRLESADPIRVAGIQELRGPVEVETLVGGDVTVRSGARVTRPAPTSAGDVRPLTIELTGTLRLEDGATIDVSGLGYAPHTTFPGEGLPTNGGGGSHVGYGGLTSASHVPGAAFGSLTRPQEGGGGGWGSLSQPGGGVARIAVDRLVLEGTGSGIRANGGSNDAAASTRGGGGGSLWITAREIVGDGFAEARGGRSGANHYGSGGGGAIAVQYETASASFLENLRAWGGEVHPVGGAGSVHLTRPGSTHGDLVIDTGPVGGGESALPSLGSGVAAAGSAGDTLVTDRVAAVPAFFLDHWVEIVAASGEREGFYRVAAIDGLRLVLAAGGDGPPSVDEGDRWYGAYRLDSFQVRGFNAFSSVDRVYVDGVLLDTNFSHLPPNPQGPTIDPEKVTIAVGAIPGSYRVDVAGDAVSDPDGVAELRLGSGRSWMRAPWRGEGVSFLWAGVPGERPTLTAVDDHGVLRLGTELRLPPLPGDPALAARALPAGEQVVAAAVGRSVAGAWTALADRTLRLWQADELVVEVLPRDAGDAVVALAASADGEQLVVGRRERLEVVATDGRAEGFAVLALPADSHLLDLATVDDQPLALVARRRPGHAEEVRLLAVELGNAPRQARLSRLSREALPATHDVYRLVAGAGLIGVVATAQAPGLVPDVLYGFPAPAARALEAPPEAWSLGGVEAATGGWSFAGAWTPPGGAGILLRRGATVRLLASHGDGWRRVTDLDVEEPVIAAGAEDAILTVVVEGAVLAYDLTDPRQPVLRSRLTGSAHRAVVAGSSLLFAPGFAAPPVTAEAPLPDAVPGALRRAVPAEGFVPVLDGAGQEIDR